MPRASLEKLEWDEANGLASRIEADGFDVALAKGDGVRTRDGWLILEAEGSTRSARWASTNAVGLVPSEHWSGPGDETQLARYVVQRTDGPLPAFDATAATPSDLRKPVPNQFTEVRISDQLDGPMNGFGERFWALLKQSSSHLRKRLEADVQLVAVTYSDRYIHRPIAARTVYEILGALRAESGGVGDHTTFELSTLSVGVTGKYPVDYQDDWQEPADQREALGAILAAVGDGAAKVVFGSKNKVAHHRELKLTWLDGTVIRVRLDHGVGFLMAPRTPKLDFRLSGGEQAKRILEEKFEVRAWSNHKSAPTPVYVN